MKKTLKKGHGLSMGIAALLIVSLFIFAGCPPNPGPNPGPDPEPVPTGPLQTWTAVSDSTFGTSGYPIINTIAYGGGKFVAGGDRGINPKMVHSSDGISWTAVTVSSILLRQSSRSITYGGDKFGLAAQPARLASSSDGITWTAVSDSTFGTSIISTIAYGGGKFVAGGCDGKGIFLEYIAVYT
ncbi:hypothetical protein FACS189442_6190 [Spirochaetia bacterium]|nr:hypothetical protein FACS189442_6190 [Spirochaetia bacterium]